jgi:hypothetical protein
MTAIKGRKVGTSGQTTSVAGNDEIMLENCALQPESTALCKVAYAVMQKKECLFKAFTI